MELQRIDEREYENRLEICEEELKFYDKSIEFKLNFIEYKLDQFAQGTKITVFDDSVLCGGTKSRFLLNVLESESEKTNLRKYNEYIYISSPYGGAQIALVIAIRQINFMRELGTPKRAAIFVNIKGENAPFVRIVESFIKNKPESDWIQIFYKNDPDSAALDYQMLKPTERIILNSGFDYEESLKEIQKLGNRIIEEKGTFNEVWVATGSGTLIRGLQRSKGLGKKFFAVAVTGGIPVIREEGAEVEGILHEPPFKDPAKFPPPFLSATRYDAKVWQYVKDRKYKGNILLWNVM
ncbi:hypothetical protein LCGC14_2504370 [marine sediment metagenome]|uniref:Tryptophan synthase beta chain-like PALP domain-containing protein n=1 Tax=marine sediment metagenome TaxID=412755 RepID=A0A0F9DCP2_9ZZZZ